MADVYNVDVWPRATDDDPLRRRWRFGVRLRAGCLARLDVRACGGNGVRLTMSVWDGLLWVEDWWSPTMWGQARITEALEDVVWRAARVDWREGRDDRLVDDFTVDDCSECWVPVEAVPP